MQSNKIETTKKVKFIDLQTEQLKKSKLKYEITDKEVGTLDPDTKVYASVGRMFVLSAVPILREEINMKQDKISQAIKHCEDSKNLLMKSLKDQEDSLRELVQQKKEADK
jgi:prefoldin subunit 1